MTLNPLVLMITALAVVASFFNNSTATRQGQTDSRSFVIPLTDTMPRPGPLVATSYGCVQVLRGNLVVVFYQYNGGSGYAGPIHVPAGYSIRNSTGCGANQGPWGITGYTQTE
jgi:hypothetical protein